MPHFDTLLETNAASFIHDLFLIPPATANRCEEVDDFRVTRPLHRALWDGAMLVKPLDRRGLLPVGRPDDSSPVDGMHMHKLVIWDANNT